MPSTLTSRPRNNELSKARAASTCSGSANSTYAYLVKSYEARQKPKSACHICLPFRVARKFITNNGYPVNGSTSLEVHLNLFRCCSIINLECSFSREERRQTFDRTIPTFPT